MPARFSWVDQRLVQARHLDRLDVHAAALYLFLITVANAQGLSWYGDDAIARRLSMESARLRQARGALVQAGLLAFADGLYQVLALDDAMQQPPKPAAVPSAPCPPATPTAAATSLPSPALPPATPTDRATARHHLAAIHAVLERRT